jgi:hypothetical protein
VDAPVQEHVRARQDLQVVLVEGDELEQRNVADEELGPHGRLGVVVDVLAIELTMYGTESR